MRVGLSRLMMTSGCVHSVRAGDGSVWPGVPASNGAPPTLAQCMATASEQLYANRTLAPSERRRLAGTTHPHSRTPAHSHTVVAPPPFRHTHTAASKPQALPPPTHTLLWSDEVAHVAEETAQRTATQGTRRTAGGGAAKAILDASDAVRLLLGLPPRLSEAQRAEREHKLRHEVRVPPQLDTETMRRIQPRRALTDPKHKADAKDRQRAHAKELQSRNAGLSTVTEVCAWGACVRACVCTCLCVWLHHGVLT